MSAATLSESGRPPSTALTPRVRRRVRRTLSRHRLLLVALVLGVGALAAFAATRPPTTATVSVAVVARDLAPGRPLVTADVQTAEADPSTLPDGAIGPTDIPYGRLVAAPARRGEVLTDVAVLGPAVADNLPVGHALTTVAIRALVPGLLQVGDVVSIVATDPRRPTDTTVVAAAATVMLVPGGSTGGAGSDQPTTTSDGSLLVVAVPAAEALELSGLSTTQVVDVVVPAR